MKDSYAATLTVREKDYVTVLYRYQNYWPKNVAWGHDFLPFITGGFLSSRSGGQSEIGVDLPLTGPLVALTEAALEKSYLFELELRKFFPMPDSSPPGQYTVVASYLGMVVSASYQEGGITLGLGSTLDPVEASAPPRVFTTAIAGRPPKL